MNNIYSIPLPLTFYPVNTYFVMIRYWCAIKYYKLKKISLNNFCFSFKHTFLTVDTPVLNLDVKLTLKYKTVASALSVGNRSRSLARRAGRLLADSVWPDRRCLTLFDADSCRSNTGRRLTNELNDGLNGRTYCGMWRCRNPDNGWKRNILFSHLVDKVYCVRFCDYMEICDAFTFRNRYNYYYLFVSNT